MKMLFLYIVKTKNQPLLAGLSPTDWLIKGAEGTPFKVIEEGEKIVPPQSDYFAVLTPETPLVTVSYLRDLIGEMEKRGHLGLEIGAGMLVKTVAYHDGFRPKRRADHPSAMVLKTREDAFRIEKILYRKIAEISAQNGVIVPDADAVKIDALSTVEAGATVEPYSVVTASRVENGAVIGSFSEVENSVIKACAKITRSIVRESKVGERTTVGPFAYIRNQSVIGESCRIGDFVEVKKSTLGQGVKAAHLAYIGDANVGDKTNVGCGTVFANYDGREKHATTVGKSVFIGANSNLVAPLSIGDNAYIAAATTVTKDVPNGAFVIGRVRAEEKRK